MNSILVLIAVVAGVAAIIQLVRLNETASKLKKEKTEEIVTEDENNMMAYGWLIFMVLFFGFTIWGMAKYGYGGLGEAASVHGKQLDWLLQLNYWIILPVFFLTNALLFIFAFKYRYNKNRKATYFSHSNKLELIWTVVPSAALAVIIFMGLKTWVNIMFDAPEEGNPVVVEAYAEQFGWTFRLSGENNQLGDSDYKLICGGVKFVNAKGDSAEITGNPLGIISKDFVLAKYQEIDNSIVQLEKELHAANYIEGEETHYEPDEVIQEKLDKIETLNILKYRIQSGIESKLTNDSIDQIGGDDVFLAADLHLVVNRPVTFKFRSKDVIHSAWFPHFRAQMNCVPGLTTSFTFTPSITTEEFANNPETQALYKEINEVHNDRLKSIGEEEEKVDFNFILLCNKICGAGHHNMQRKIIVESEADYEKWYECEDFTEAMPVKPRVDIMGRPLVYNGWNASSIEGAENNVNMAVVNASKAEKEEIEEVAPMTDTLVAPVAIDTMATAQN